MDTTYKVILKTTGLKGFIMPSGFWPDVEIHCWGAGGGKGRGGVNGGGGGYAKTVIDVYEGDEVSYQIGQPGGNGGYPTGGAGGVDNTNTYFRGGNAGTASDEDADSGAGGGGGGASWVAINGTYVCVGAGGGGAGGYGDDSSGGYAGLPGGVTTNGLNTVPRGGDSGNGGASGGGGGAGYPYGGKAGATYGDDAPNPPAGSGGQNYGNVTLAGSSINPGGKTVSYYPGEKRGEAGNAGYIIIILRRKLQAFVKDSGAWATLSNIYYRSPTTTSSTTTPSATQSVALTTVGGPQTWRVPDNVTKIKVEIIGGGGGGGRGCELDPYVSGGGGGGSGGFNVVELTVTPSTTIQYFVGAGGSGISSKTSDDGGGGTGTAGGTSWFISDTSYTATGGQPAANSTSNHYDVGGAGGFPNGVAGSNGQKINSNDGGPTTGGSGGGIVGKSTGGAGAVAVTGTAGSPGSGYGAGGGGGAGKGGGTVAQGGGGEGKPGAILISYTTGSSTVTTQTGGWKEIDQVYTKVNGSWKPILANKSVSVYDGVAKRVSANVSIIANTNDYNLIDNLPSAYFAGLMDITVWVEPGVVIRGVNTYNGFSVQGFNAGDKIKIINYGTLQGRGGYGGKGGVYIAPSKFDSGTNTPGQNGGYGGAGLLSTTSLVLENNGTIAGGGGGGGGGGVGYDNNWKSPSYTQGGQAGGGGGYGTGYNNGTLTAGGAGQNVSSPAGDGGAGGARGQAGSRGGDGTYNKGGAGGAAGPAIASTGIVTYANVGTVTGPIWATVNGLV